MWISTGSPGGSRPITKCEAISGTSDGFTLLETLVAFAIVVVVLMSVLPAISGAVRVARDADNQTRALLWAESILDTLGHRAFIEEGDDGGVTPDGFGWVVSIRSLATPQSAGAFPQRLAAFAITVTVRRSQDDSARATTLTTIRLASPR